MKLFNFCLFLLAVLTCFASTVLLARAYWQKRVRLLLWSTLCFVGLTISNVLLFFDFVVFPTQVDLRPWRHLISLAGLLFLLYGFIWDAEEEGP
jgi:hypothetical protein